MTERCFGISYLFTPTPTQSEIRASEMFFDSIMYNPIVIYAEDGNVEIQKIRANRDFELSSNDLAVDYKLFSEPQNSHKEMLKRSKAAQERIISEYICMIILEKARAFPDDDLTFLIRDEFQTEKIVGRLGYLGLPMDRLHIMFVAFELSAFTANYIAQYAVPPRYDLMFLLSDEYRGNVWGPYPNDDTVSMLRTYYCSFSLNDSYPLRINLFGQMLKKGSLDREKKHIESIFLNGGTETESYPIIKGRNNVVTRLPKVLVTCEESVEREKEEYESDSRDSGIRK